MPPVNIPSAAPIKASMTRDEPRLPAFAASAFLVAVPVFVQAPLVRLAPGFSLGLTLLWLLGSWNLLAQQGEQKGLSQLWGDLFLGFTWTWLAGSLYWGWFRWEPLIHLPIEAIGLPFVAVCLYFRKAQVGSYFYLGSLLGTAITDAYFYWTDLIPYWRQLMQVAPTEIAAVLHTALQHMATGPGLLKALVLLSALVMLGTRPLKQEQAHWWAFGSAVLSTILVDSLFFLAAVIA